FFQYSKPAPVDREAIQELQRKAKEMAQEYQYAKPVPFNFDTQALKELNEKAWTLSEKYAADKFNYEKFSFANDAHLFAQKMAIGRGPRMGDDRLYEAGTRAIENHRYEEALEDFNQLVARAGQRTDGALYWKAYTLDKLGRRDDALASIAELRKSY